MSVGFGSVASGQTVTGQTVTGGTLEGATQTNITFKNCSFIGQHVIKAKPNTNLLIDGGQKINDASVTPTDPEGQFEVDGNAISSWGTARANVTFRNFISDSGSGDGIQIEAVRGVLLDGCEFRNHAQ